MIAPNLIDLTYHREKVVCDYPQRTCSVCQVVKQSDRRVSCSVLQNKSDNQIPADPCGPKTLKSMRNKN